MKKLLNRAEKKKFSYAKRVKPGSIQNVVRSKTLNTNVSNIGKAKKTNIKINGRMNSSSVKN